MSPGSITMATPRLSLREVVATDAYTLWLWANDPATRRASHDRPSIPWAEHIRWLDRVLDGRDHIALIAEIERQPIGSIRFDTVDGWATARLSYVVAPESRRRSLSRPLIETGIEFLRVRHPEAEVFADVREDNPASLRVFRGLGWGEGRSGAPDIVRFCLRNVR